MSDVLDQIDDATEQRFGELANATDGLAGTVSRMAGVKRRCQAGTLSEEEARALLRTEFAAYLAQAEAIKSRLEACDLLQPPLSLAQIADLVALV